MTENPMAELNCTATMIASVRFQDGIPVSEPGTGERSSLSVRTWTTSVLEFGRNSGGFQTIQAPAFTRAAQKGASARPRHLS